MEPGTVGWPDAVRGRVPVAVQVPAVDPAQAHELVRMSGCRTPQPGPYSCGATGGVDDDQSYSVRAKVRLPKPGTSLGG